MQLLFGAGEVSRLTLGEGSNVILFAESWREWVSYGRDTVVEACPASFLIFPGTIVDVDSPMMRTCIFNLAAHFLENFELSETPRSSVEEGLA